MCVRDSSLGDENQTWTMGTRRKSRSQLARDSSGLILEGLLIFALARDGGRLSEADSKPRCHLSGLRNPPWKRLHAGTFHTRVSRPPGSLAAPGFSPRLTGVSWGRLVSRNASSTHFRAAWLCREAAALVTAITRPLTAGELQAELTRYSPLLRLCSTAAVTLRAEAASELVTVTCWTVTEMTSTCCSEGQFLSGWHNTEESTYLFEKLSTWIPFPFLSAAHA